MGDKTFHRTGTAAHLTGNFTAERTREMLLTEPWVVHHPKFE